MYLIANRLDIYAYILQVELQEKYVEYASSCGSPLFTDGITSSSFFKYIIIFIECQTKNCSNYFNVYGIITICVYTWYLYTLIKFINAYIDGIFALASCVFA